MGSSGIRTRTKKIRREKAWLVEIEYFSNGRSSLRMEYLSGHVDKLVQYFGFGIALSDTGFAGSFHNTVFTSYRPDPTVTLLNW